MKTTIIKSCTILLLTGSSFLASAAQAANGFSSTGNLGTPRYNHSATLLPNGKVLVAGGEGEVPGMGGNTLASTEVYDPATGTWSSAGSLGTARYWHTATLLPNGKVLIAGGLDIYFFYGVVSGELYDPATGSWTPTGTPATRRYGHTATLLPNAKVLIAGGSILGGSLNTAELYDPAAGTWSATGSLGTARVGHTATLLRNGKVLVTAGDDFQNTAELHDPATGTWSPAGRLSFQRLGHTATLLPNGKVLVAGGVNTNYVASPSAELYDPTVGTWSPTGRLGTERSYHTATLLPNGKVLIVGGQDANVPLPKAGAELYDPATGTWAPAGNLATARSSGTATLLADGNILIAGGLDFYLSDDAAVLSAAELYHSFLNPILNPLKLGDGSFKFSFSNPSGPSYRVLASTNLAAPLNTWSNLGLATETPAGSGQFQFTDHQATNYPRRFYRVTSP